MFTFNKKDITMCSIDVWTIDFIVEFEHTFAKVHQKNTCSKSTAMKIIVKRAKHALRHTIRSDTFFVNWTPFKNNGKLFLFHLSALFVLKIFKFFLSLLFFQSLWRYNLGKKQLQCTYWPVFREVKATRQWNLAS